MGWLVGFLSCSERLGRLDMHVSYGRLSKRQRHERGAQLLHILSAMRKQI